MSKFERFSEEKRPPGSKIYQNRMNQKREIIRNTFKILYEKGFDKTTLEAIASEMGMPRAALYRYFTSKNELLFHCHKVIFEAWMEKLEQPKTIRDPKTRLAAMLEAHILLFIEDFPFSIPTLIPVDIYPPEYKEKIIGYRKQINEPYIQCLKEWRGERPDELKDIDDRVILNTMFSATNAVPQWWNGKSDPKMLVKQVVSILIDGIRK